ncbi:MAG: site-2 protease family protein [Syntrophorhabdaceae bacterium]|nr:site-2 protease family protein [Syntrophorhabdales bacterium]MBP9561541.1 site-2 protease family protein [Syntrophorhabdaceae bacterium]
MIHIILFILTFGSTWFVGGFLYSLSIMSILFAHEMGHYIMSRKYNIPATLPYFIPFPLPPFGTFGALIKMKGTMIDKRALFDIGAGGPLAGFMVSLPFIYVGIKLSHVEAVHAQQGFMQLGDPLLFKFFQMLLVGDIPTGYDLVLHPFAYAGWVGLFVTALNLLPVGQLDGGHIVYAVFGEDSRKIYITVLIGLGTYAVFFSQGWLALIILLFIFGINHPSPLDTETPLDRKRRFLSLVVLIIFILSFIPKPFPALTVTMRSLEDVSRLISP